MLPHRSRRLVLGLAMTAALGAATSVKVQQADTLLLRLPKVQPFAVAADFVRQLTPFQELDSAWLVEASQATTDRMKAAGLSVEIVDTAPATKAYDLVFTPSRSRCDALGQAGDAWWVDEGICLFAPRGGPARELVPHDLSIKGISPFPGATIRFTTGDLPRAVPRMSAVGRGAAAPLVAQMADSVDRARLVASIDALERFGTRYASTAACEAAGTEIGTWFRALGLPTEFEYFQFGTSPRYTTSNVIAALPGRVDPSRIVIVSAHYDSYSDQRLTLAPGADDNASGTAVVVELARILKDHAFDFTVKFVAWGAEEWGLNGSRYHAQQARQRGDRIVASLAADMVGYVDVAPEDLDIISNEASQWLAARYATAAAAYGGLGSVRQVRATFGSDCTSFWEQDYASACSIEDNPLKNPYYHRTTDVLATLSLDFLAASARATLGVVAELAQPVSSPSPPTSLEVAAQTSTSLFRRARSAVLTWERSHDQVAGYHVYRAASPHGGYRRLTSSPVTASSYVDSFLDAEATFYYVVTAIDSSGRESNYSGEATEHDPRGSR